MNILKLLLPCALLVLVGACSRDTDEEAGHPWESQVEALEKAKGVEQMMQDAADAKLQTIDEQE